MPIVQCRVCSKEFCIKPSHQKLGWGKYCSRVCSAKSQFNGKKIPCTICGKEIYRSKTDLAHSISGKYFCSRKCQTLWRNSIYIEDRSSNWKNGIKSYRNIMTRRDLLSKCYLCKIAEKRVLIIHHKDSVRTNNKVTNLVCLCHNCHFLVHHYSEFDDRLKNNN